jgi:hypothetical protein
MLKDHIFNIRQETKPLIGCLFEHAGILFLMVAYWRCDVPQKIDALQFSMYTCVRNEYRILEWKTVMEQNLRILDTE